MRFASNVFVIVRSCCALVLITSLAACGDDDSEPRDAEIDDGGGPDSSTSPNPKDEIDAGMKADAEADADIDATADEDGGAPDNTCDVDADCDDGLYCNGAETCVGGRCSRGVAQCTTEHPCVEHTDSCECSVPDDDGDGVPAKECGFPDGDCDDGSPLIFPGGDEVCDPLGVDEDCNPETFNDNGSVPLDGDRDGDGYVSTECFNVGPDGERHAGDDCRDNNESTHPGTTETCDYEDNDCDGTIDEKPGPDGEPTGIAGGLQESFYPDVDRDGFPDHDAEELIACGFTQPPGYLPAFFQDDCDDDDRFIHPHAIEVCDGVDNDCDGLEDSDDNDGSPLLKPYDFTDTLVECVPHETDPDDADWMITECPEGREWCTGVVETGCSTDATTILNCRECGRTCNFACGTSECDEVIEVAAGSDHTCAITSEVAACWGRGALGRLGTGSTSNQYRPAPVISLVGASHIAAGANSSCAVVGEARNLYCWGSNQYGLLGTQEPGLEASDVLLPVVGAWGEPQLADIERVDIAAEHACALTTAGALYCWGSEADGRLGNNSTSSYTDYPVSVERADFFVFDADHVAVGEQHGCLVTFDGYVECWGDNTFGQLGDPDFAESHSAVARPVPGLDQVSGIAAGLNHTCVLREREVLCWGGNGRLQLGREASVQDGVPTEVADLDGVVAVVAGSQFTCALDELGAVWCWGSNVHGERGDADGEDSAMPHAIAMAEEIAKLSAGGNHVCALSLEHRLYCWGKNLYGQLGMGSASYEAQPVPQPTTPLSR